MSRKEPSRRQPDRLSALLSEGAHGAAVRAAHRALADQGTTPDERAQAGAVLASLAPEPFAVAAGVTGATVAIAIAIWMVLGGAR